MKYFGWTELQTKAGLDSNHFFLVTAKVNGAHDIDPTDKNEPQHKYEEKHLWEKITSTCSESTDQRSKSEQMNEQDAKPLDYYVGPAFPAQSLKQRVMCPPTLD